MNTPLKQATSCGDNLTYDDDDDDYDGHRASLLQTKEREI